MRKRDWTDRMQCSCGMTFRSMSAEAKHRHNFPLLCKGKEKERARVVGDWLLKVAKSAEQRSAE